MANGKQQHKNLVRKVATHKVTTGAAGKKKAAAERIKRAEAARLITTQAILAKKEAKAANATRPSVTVRPISTKTQQRRKVAAASARLTSASPAIHAVAAATKQRQMQLA
jgi:hypothetical protein